MLNRRKEKTSITKDKIMQFRLQGGQGPAGGGDREEDSKGITRGTKETAKENRGTTS